MKKIGLILICLLLCVSCSPVKTPPVMCLHPMHLMTDTPAPLFYGNTNGDLAEYAKLLEFALKDCNTDKATMRNAGGQNMETKQ